MGTHPVSRLYRADQRDAPPHVDVPVQSSGVGQLVLGRRDTQDGLKVPRLPEDASLWGQCVPTQSPELWTGRMFTCPVLRTSEGLCLDFLSHLNVFDSTADETTGLERVPVHVKDLWTRDVSPESLRTPASRGTCSYPVGVSCRRGDHASSPPVPHGQRVLGVQTDRHQPLRDRQRRVWEEPGTPAPGPRCVSPVLLHRRPDRPRRECGHPSGWTPSACRRCPRCR